MTYVYLIVSEGEGGTHVTAYHDEGSRDAAYVYLINLEYGTDCETADEAWEVMDKNVTASEWNCWTTDAPLYGEAHE